MMTGAMSLNLAVSDLKLMLRKALTDPIVETLKIEMEKLAEVFSEQLEKRLSSLFEQVVATNSNISSPQREEENYGKFDRPLERLREVHENGGHLQIVSQFCSEKQPDIGREFKMKCRKRKNAPTRCLNGKLKSKRKGSKVAKVRRKIGINYLDSSRVYRNATGTFDIIPVCCSNKTYICISNKNIWKSTTRYKNGKRNSRKNLKSRRKNGYRNSVPPRAYLFDFSHFDITYVRCRNFIGARIICRLHCAHGTLCKLRSGIG